MSTLERAIEIAASAHAGQRDKAGLAYILHPLRVMLAVSTPEARIAAVLHDVVEDTSWTLDRLEAEGFDAPILEAVSLLTHEPGSEPPSEDEYLAYVARAGANTIAREVKIADLRDNLDLTRIREPSARDYARLQRYQRALVLLAGYAPPAADPSVAADDGPERVQM